MYVLKEKLIESVEFWTQSIGLMDHSFYFTILTLDAEG